jgi:hypothetical protein
VSSRWTSPPPPSRTSRAITAISDTEILLVCSQVLSDDGSYKKKRTRLGLLSFPEGFDKPSKMAIHDGLRDDILPFLEGHADKFKDFTALSTKPPREGGLSIEGAAYDQKTGILYLGTRDGVTRREGSVIIELKNVKDMIATNAKPVFGNLYQLPSVEYSGIRDLSIQGDKLLVLLGAMRGRSTPPSTLAWWSLAKPEELEVIEVEGIASIKDAEGVYIDPATKEVMVVQDLNEEKVGAALDDIAHGFDLKTAKIRAITRPTPVPGTPKPTATAAAPGAATGTDAAKPAAPAAKPAGPAVKPPAKPTTNKPATGATEKPAAPKATPAATK